jgi:hypothetical protein
MNIYDTLPIKRVLIFSHTVAGQQRKHDWGRARLRTRKTEVKESKLLSIDENKRYTLTEKGKKNLEAHLDAFIRTFYDIDEMKSCCCERSSSKES